MYNEKYIKEYIKLYENNENQINEEQTEYLANNIIKNISFKNKIMESYKNLIIEIMKLNKGYIMAKMLKPLNISRNYLSILEKEKIIEKVEKGIYILNDKIEDSYYVLQQKYKKIIFSHMNALYFHGLTEEITYKYSITIPKEYHVSKLNKNNNIFYVDSSIYELGITYVETPFGNKVKAYDKERCICDIIKSKNRMNFDSVKYSIRTYLNSNDKDLNKLFEYADKMKIKGKVVSFVEMLI